MGVRYPIDECSRFSLNQCTQDSVASLSSSVVRPPDLPDAANAVTELLIPEHPLDLHDQLRVRDRARGGGGS